ncbi:MAG TPA: anhydro-N-acetylmuramic acid kinase [Candidatus Hydrogenedentes bacterium]|nr:anhydro-N-acetylmuramic acid kinase [Candidatus Hydrogenedentota bacterium]HOS01957.1 anhydro-N-acetylmuramic acid kinase [Candidatus Hydrogenedentota bacterium]
MDWTELRHKPVRFGIGLMSGASCEGIDAVLARIKGTSSGLLFKLIRHKTFPYTPAFRLRLQAPRLDAHELALLDFELGERLAEAALDMIQAAKDEGIGGVDFVASHGHAVAHIPPRDANPCGALQIGQPAVIAERAHVPVVSQFRMRDMAAGGQGWPLGTYADWLLFSREDRTVACLTLGGIASYTVVTPEFKEILAFDVGPCNIAIDGAMRLLTAGEQEMDADGSLAAKGEIIGEFIDYLLDHPYFGRVPPKSTSREEFAPEIYLRDAIAGRREYPNEDIVATVTESIAINIIRAYSRFLKPQYDIARIIVGGGGAMNKTLMRHLKRGFGDVVVRTSDDYGIPHAARVAADIAILGNETLCGTPANVPQATGARHRVVLGVITPP